MKKMDFLVGQCERIHLPIQEMQVQSLPWVGKIPWGRKWPPTPVCLPGKSHGQRNLAGYSPWGHKRVECNLPIKQQQIIKNIISNDGTLYGKKTSSLGDGLGVQKEGHNEIINKGVERGGHLSILEGMSGSWGSTFQAEGRVRQRL